MVEDVLLTPVEAARILGVKRQTLSVWRLNGRGPRFVRVGRLIRYRRGTIEKWLEGNEVSSTSNSGKF
jgi:excisionase family DNA binding protein